MLSAGVLGMTARQVLSVAPNLDEAVNTASWGMSGVRDMKIVFMTVLTTYFSVIPTVVGKQEYGVTVGCTFTQYSCNIVQR